MTSLAAGLGPRVSAHRERFRALRFGLALVAGALVFGLLAGDLVAGGHFRKVAVLAVVLLPVAVWKRPQLGPVVLMSAALLIEQVPSSPGSGAALPGASSSVNIPITGHLPLFAGLGSLHVNPSDLLVLTVAIIYLARTDAETRWWPRTHVSRAIGALLVAVLFGIFLGLAHHGSLRVAFMEARPYVYLAATYLLTAVLVRSRSALRSVLWALVIATGVKALQGVYLYIHVARHMVPRPQSVIGHEAAYFFAAFIFLVAALWIFEVRGRLRTTATWLLPVVIFANLVNDRRAAWLLLGGGLLALVVVAYASLPARRPKLRRVGIIFLALSVVYFPFYWNKGGTLAQPARAIHSQFTADPRDRSSDRYRVQEDANLKLNIKQGGILGQGFGVPIDYALPIVNLRKGDPSLNYVPHNDVLYVLMRMGLLGAIAMWAVLGTAIVAGCRLAKSADREIAVVGTLVVASLVAYALEGSVDLGFYFYRIAFVTGTLLGLAEAARRIQRSSGLPIGWRTARS